MDKFGDTNHHLMYDLMSKKLGLHTNTITLMRQNSEKIKRLKSAASSHQSRYLKHHQVMNNNIKLIN